MSAATAPVLEPRYTEQEYLALERAEEFRHEYIEGKIRAMAGASRWHSRIVVAAIREIATQLQGHMCEPFNDDVRVKIEAANTYTYPDISIACHGEFEDEHFDTLLNPTVIIEVLSSSTASYDRGEKFTRYRRLASLRDYILISQDHPQVAHYSLHGDGFWMLRDYEGLDATFTIRSVNVTLALRDLYERVDFQRGEYIVCPIGSLDGLKSLPWMRLCGWGWAPQRWP